VTRTMGYLWQLRTRMAEKGLFQTSDLVPLLAERGVHLSREQVFRLVTQPPQRLSMDTLAALCDILDVTPNDLIEITAAATQVRKTASSRGGAAPAARRTRVRRPDEG
jgi:DNA-binding Xre family transcriptional regulator